MSTILADSVRRFTLETDLLAWTPTQDGRKARALDTDNTWTYYVESGWVLEQPIVGEAGATGDPGAPGSQWYVQAGIPANAIGNDTDLALNTDTGDVFERISGVWTLVGNIRGASASSGATGKQWYVGSGAPSAGIGADGEFYYDQTNFDLYEKAVTFATLTPTSMLAETGTTTSEAVLATSGTAALSNNRLELLAVLLVGPSAAPAISSVTGAGMTWVAVRTTTVGTRTFALYRGLATSGATTEAITVNYSGGGSGTLRYAVHVTEWTGMDTGGTNGSSAIVQSSAVGALAATNVIGNLAAFADSTHNATFLANFHAASETTTPGAGLTELSDTHGASPSLAFETAWQSGQNLAPSANWSTSGDTVAISVEIAAAQSGAAWSKIGVLLGSGTVTQGNPADPSGTSNTSGVMMGLAVSHTPKTSRVMVVVSGDVSNTSGNGGANQLRYGTGVAPANGVALTGTTAGGLVSAGNAGTGGVGFSCSAIITGLTPGTAYWFDLALARIGGAGTTNDEHLSVSVHDV